MLAVCLLSGGIDSTTCAALAKADGFDLLGLTVNYGQRHKREINSAKAVADFFAIKTHIILSSKS